MCETQKMTETPNENEERLDDENFAAIWHGYDAAEGQMLEELLRQEGFEARLIGTRTASLIGVGQFTATLRLEVPESAVEEALKVLEKFLSAPPEAEPEDAGD